LRAASPALLQKMATLTASEPKGKKL